ncbi:MAG: carbohydrate ABC transporter permease, partial [Candidatus Riflebacteria bacterium]
MKGSIWKERAIFVGLAMLSLTYLYPWAYMVLRSFLRHEPGLSFAELDFTLEYYGLVLGNAGFVQYSLNSFIVLAAVLLANLVFSVLVGYAFARYRFPFKRLLFWLVMATLMLPKQTLMIPLLDLMVRAGLYNSLWALILPFCVDGFNLFLMKQYIEGLPRDLEDAARADGCGEFEILWHVVFPLAR